MAERKKIKSDWITGVLGYPWRVNIVDEEGQPLKDGDQLVYEAATTRDIILGTVLGIPGSIQRRLDSARVAACVNQLEKTGGDQRGEDGSKTPGPDIELKPKVYEWLHALLDRKVPITKEMHDRGVKTRTYGMTLWDAHTAHIVNQLKDLEHRKAVLDDDEDDDDDGDE